MTRAVPWSGEAGRNGFVIGCVSLGDMSTKSSEVAGFKGEVFFHRKSGLGPVTLFSGVSAAPCGVGTMPGLCTALLSCPELCWALSSLRGLPDTVTTLLYFINSSSQLRTYHPRAVGSLPRTLEFRLRGRG